MISNSNISIDEIQCTKYMNSLPFHDIFSANETKSVNISEALRHNSLEFSFRETNKETDAAYNKENDAHGGILTNVKRHVKCHVI